MKYTLKNWSVIQTSSFYTAPEYVKNKLCGEVYGNPDFEDGQVIITSAIDSVDKLEIATKTGNVYILDGPPFKDYINWLRENDLDYDPVNPIKFKTDPIQKVPDKETAKNGIIYDPRNLSSQRKRNLFISSSYVIKPGADLRGAHLYGTNLAEADLTGANLANAHLYGTNLSYANLRGADLCGANLAGADITGANLVGAKRNSDDEDIPGWEVKESILVKIEEKKEENIIKRTILYLMRLISDK